MIWGQWKTNVVTDLAKWNMHYQKEFDITKTELICPSRVSHSPGTVNLPIEILVFP